jgi:hypothetical protein
VAAGAPGPTCATVKSARRICCHYRERTAIDDRDATPRTAVSSRASIPAAASRTTATSIPTGTVVPWREAPTVLARRPAGAGSLSLLPGSARATLTALTPLAPREHDCYHPADCGYIERQAHRMGTRPRRFPVPA